MNKTYKKVGANETGVRDTPVSSVVISTPSVLRKLKLESFIIF